MMSHTEAVMVLALGSALTFVLFLLFGRVAWNVMNALEASRRARQAPLDLLNLQAEKDRSRAQHAIIASRLEIKLDHAKLRVAEQMAEVSRSRNRIEGLIQDIGHKDEEIKSLRQQLDIYAMQLQARDSELRERTFELHAAQRSISDLTHAAASAQQETFQVKLAEAGREVQEFQNQLYALDDLPAKAPAPTAAKKQNSAGRIAALTQRFRLLQAKYE